MKALFNKKGSAIITAIGLGILLLIVIATVSTFTSYRTQTVIQESKKVKALGFAEGGLEIALGLLANNNDFITHKVKIQGEDLLWDSEESWKNTLESNSDHGFSIEETNKGTLSGKLGDGEFKIRIGNIPYKDIPETKTIDESKSYVKIEALGLYDNTIRKVEAIVNRRYITREFLMYDGGVLSLIYGQTHENNHNVFATGHLYGHEGIELGAIKQSRHGGYKYNGTDQELHDITAIMSGNGGIYVYSDIKTKFMDKNGKELETTLKANTTYPSNGTYSSPEAEKFGEFPGELQGTTPPIQSELSKWIKDKNSGMTIPPTLPSFEQYKKLAQENGKYYTSKTDSYRIHSKWTADGKNSLDVVYLDFGNNITEGKVDVPANGIIYSDLDVVIKGNPPKDVTIVSEKNVFVAGDYNQAGDKNNIAERYGFPQEYPATSNPLKANDYRQKVKDILHEDANKKDGEFKHHVASTVIAKERVVYDYRNPIDVCENEIVPFLKYELAKAISTEENKAEECLKPDNIQSLIITATDTIDGFNQCVDEFTSKYTIGENNSKANDLKEKIKSIYEGCNGSFNYDKLDELTTTVWQTYVDDFNSDIKGQPSQSGMQNDHGIYQLVYGLRKKMGSSQDKAPLTDDQIKDSPDDYLFYPEMTTNAMFVSCGKLANETYAGPDVSRYYNELGHFSGNGDHTVQWFLGKGLVHRVYGSETNLRLYDVHKLSSTDNNYTPPTRRKIYDETLPLTGGNAQGLDLTGFIVLSWQDTAASREEYEAF